MKDALSYKGFIGSVQFSADDDVFYGKIEGIDDLVSYEGTSVAELKKRKRCFERCFCVNKNAWEN